MQLTSDKKASITRICVTVALVCMTASLFACGPAPELNIATGILLIPALILGSNKAKAFSIVLILLAATAVYQDYQESQKFVRRTPAQSTPPK